MDEPKLPTLAEVHAFLLGTGPIHGLWFGDDDSGRPYWWRKYLREALNAKQPSEPVDAWSALEMLKRRRLDAISLGGPTEIWVDELDAAIAAITATQGERE